MLYYNELMRSAELFKALTKPLLKTTNYLYLYLETLIHANAFI